MKIENFMIKVLPILSLWYYSLVDILVIYREILDSIVEHYTPKPPIDYLDKGKLNLFDSGLLVLLLGSKQMFQLARRGLVLYRQALIKGGKAYIAYARKQKREKKQRRIERNN